MLGELNPLAIDQIVYRLANPPSVSAALADLPVSLEDALETLDLFELKTAEDATTLLETPFLEHPSYNPVLLASPIAVGASFTALSNLRRRSMSAAIGAERRPSPRLMCRADFISGNCVVV
jgi:hypothetical protein